jgi:flagellar M-ring protein FliF
MADPAPTQPNQKNLIADLARSGRMRIAAALMVTALVGGGLGFIMLKGGSGGDVKLLYSGLDLQEAADIAGKLDTAGIKYQLQGGGSAIFIDPSKVDAARMMLSEQGLPKRGSVGWEIFDKSDALGETSFTQNIKKVRALEGELARTISSLDMVRGARVHLVLPDKPLFQKEGDPAKASVVLSLKGKTMTPEKIRAIRNLVATSVPGLELNNITIVDDQSRIWAAGGETDASGMGGASSDERKTSMEDGLRKKVVEIVENIAGPGAARVQVSADVDFNRITQSDEKYDPDSKVVRSSVTTENKSQNADTPPGDTTTVAKNVPAGAPATAPSPSPTSSAAANETSESINYEISKTVKTEVMEVGRVRRLSVAVALDDIRQPQTDPKAPPSFKARTPEELQRIEALVKSAVGFNQERGDTVSVVNIGFARPDIPPADIKAPGPFEFDKFDLVRVLEIVALLITGLALVWFVLRPLAKGLMSNDDEVETFVVDAKGKRIKVKGVSAKGLPAPEGGDEEGGSRIVARNSNGQRMVSIPDGGSTQIDIPGGERLDAGVDVDRISGQVRASSIKKISEVVQAHPEESLAIIRSWLAEENGERA